MDLRQILRRLFLLFGLISASLVWAQDGRVPPPPPPDTPVYAIVIKFVDGAGVRMGAQGRLTQKSSIARGVPEGSLRSSFTVIEAQARSRGLALKRLFELQSEDELDRWVAGGRERSGKALADLNAFYSMPLPAGTRYSQVASMLQSLAAQPHVEVAYAATLAKPTQGALSPNLEGDQDYLDAAPVGIDARHGWTLPGGRGTGVRIVDVEYAWNRGHEDAPAPFADRNNDFLDIPGGFTDDHGTAVIGVLGGLNNGIGGTGIVSEAQFGLSSVNPMAVNQVSVAAAIQWAAQRVNAGDFVLIEQQSFGPVNTNCGCGATSCNLMPVEWELANFNAIQAAVANGVIVVEAAANGSVNLDAPLYNGNFNRNVRDSGAIMVGASMSTERTPMCFSNHGTRVDVHAWGQNVATSGYGTRHPGTGLGPANHNWWYTAGFGGTSSASPIVTGAAAIIQGVRIAASQPRLTPAQMRTLLTTTGAAQTGDLARLIGPFPNVRAAILASGSGPRNLDWLPAVLHLLLN